MPSIWDTRCRIPGKVANGDTGDVACDHYHRYLEDIGLMGAIGVKAYRFSVSWSRVLPLGKGAPNETGLAFYDRLVDGLLEAGIEPWLCLYHWDLPQALQDLGGWANRDIAGWFSDYAALVGRRYGNRVKHFATFNEPSVFTLFGYALDWSAPGIIDRETNLRAIHCVNLAHGSGVAVLRNQVPDAVIGAIHNRQQVLPQSDSTADRAAAGMLDVLWNKAFPDPQLTGAYPEALAREMEPYVEGGDMELVCQDVDYFGLNHYGPIFAKADPAAVWGFAWGSAAPDLPKSDIGWPIFPRMFRDELVDLSQRYRLPIYVMENGCGGHDQPGAAGEIQDLHRIRYLDAYVSAMGEAIDLGADVRGYFVWSLLDNFEWGSGYGNRFGLVFVDFSTQKRTLKASAHWYAALIAGQPRR